MFPDIRPHVKSRNQGWLLSQVHVAMWNEALWERWLLTDSVNAVGQLPIGPKDTRSRCYREWGVPIQ